MKQFNLTLSIILLLCALVRLLTCLNGTKTDDELFHKLFVFALLVLAGIVFYAFGICEGIRDERDNWKLRYQRDIGSL